MPLMICEALRIGYFRQPGQEVLDFNDAAVSRCKNGRKVADLMEDTGTVLAR